MHFARATDLHEPNVCERNQRVIQRHNEFFFTVKRALHQSYIIDLATFFDRNSTSLNYRELLSDLKNRVKHQTYCEIENEVEKRLKENQEAIKFIKNLRDKHVAHEGKARDENLVIELAKIDELLSLTQEIFNLLSHHFDTSATIFESFKEIDSSTVQPLLYELALGYEKFVENIKVNNNL